MTNEEQHGKVVKSVRTPTVNLERSPEWEEPFPQQSLLLPAAVFGVLEHLFKMTHCVAAVTGR